MKIGGCLKFFLFVPLLSGLCWGGGFLLAKNQGFSQAFSLAIAASIILGSIAWRKPNTKSGSTDFVKRLLAMALAWGACYAVLYFGPRIGLASGGQIWFYQSALVAIVLGQALGAVIWRVATTRGEEVELDEPHLAG